VTTTYRRSYTLSEDIIQTIEDFQQDSLDSTGEHLSASAAVRLLIRKAAKEYENEEEDEEDDEEEGEAAGWSSEDEAEWLNK